MSKLTFDVWNYQKKFDRFMSVTVHDKTQISMVSSHNIDLTKEMDRLRKDCEDTIK